MLENLEEQSDAAMKWFENSYMKVNSDKYNILISRNKSEQVWAQIGKHIIWEIRTTKLSGIAIGNNLSNICMKANGKLTVLTIVKKYLHIEKTRILFKVFLESQFKYCPLTWMNSKTSVKPQIIESTSYTRKRCD